MASHSNKAGAPLVALSSCGATVSSPSRNPPGNRVKATQTHTAPLPTTEEQGGPSSPRPWGTVMPQGFTVLRSQAWVTAHEAAVHGRTSHGTPEAAVPRSRSEDAKPCPWHSAVGWGTGEAALGATVTLPGSGERAARHPPAPKGMMWENLSPRRTFRGKQINYTL